MKTSEWINTMFLFGSFILNLLVLVIMLISLQQ